MDKNRLEAFSDGVLAIVITIMILELSLPKGDTLKDFLSQGPLIASYAISYLFIAIYWVNHHLLFNRALRINVKILWCNIAWLFIMSFIPFATAWVGKHPNSFAPLAIYFADMAFACFAFHIMFYLIIKENGGQFKLHAKNIVSIITYTGAALFGGFCPIAAYIIVTVVSCWWIIPEKNKAELFNSKNDE